jgi:hypothetical protein
VCQLSAAVWTPVVVANTINLETGQQGGLVPQVSPHIAMTPQLHWGTCLTVLLMIVAIVIQAPQVCILYNSHDFVDLLYCLVINHGCHSAVDHCVDRPEHSHHLSFPGMYFI